MSQANEERIKRSSTHKNQGRPKLPLPNNDVIIEAGTKYREKYGCNPTTSSHRECLPLHYNGPGWANIIAKLRKERMTNLSDLLQKDTEKKAILIKDVHADLEDYIKKYGSEPNHNNSRHIFFGGVRVPDINAAFRRGTIDGLDDFIHPGSKRPKNIREYAIASGLITTYPIIRLRPTSPTPNP